MSDVKQLSQGRWPEILTRLGADGSTLDGKHRPCPACGGNDRFRFDDKEGRGTHICSQCGAGDGFELIQKMFTYSFKEAAKAVEEVLGIEGKTPSKEEQQAYKQKLADERIKREKQEAEKHRLAAINAQRIWDNSLECDGHPYLSSKGVKAYGIHIDGGSLVVPVRIDGEIRSIQRIKSDGAKIFLPDGEVGGGYHSIVGADAADMSRIYIAEGYATGATIRETTGNHVAIAFNAGNLGKVSKAIRSKLPDIQIIIAGDNDESKTGEAKGKAAADSVGGVFIMPPDVGNDWNDYAATHGLDAAGKEVAKQTEEPDKTLHADEMNSPCTALSDDEKGGDNTSRVVKVDGDPLTEAVERLAKLTPLEYDQVRSAEAKAMGVRAATLDGMVNSTRKALQEQQSMFADVESWPEVVNGGALLNEILATFNRFIVTPKHAPEAAALWLLNTYVHDASYHSPMMLITSPEKRCGKSTMLSLMQAMGNRSLLAANISPAAVYRAIEQWKPTLLIDEADTFLKQNDDMAGVINSGHTKTTAFVMRCDGDANEVKAFSTWCPKVIAGIGSQRDTLEDRSIMIPLRRKLEGEQVQRLRLDRNDFEDIKRKCVRWADDNYQAVHDSDPATPKGLHDRAADNWTPLFAIADLCGWREKTEFAALILSGADESESIDTILLKDIQSIYKEQGAERLASQRMCELLAAIDDRPWSEWSKGRAITTNRLAGRLKMFGIHSKAMRLPHGETLKGYELSAFSDAFGRYCDSKRYNVTSLTQPQKTEIQSVTSKNDVTLQNTKKPIYSNGCNVVTVQNATQAKREESGDLFDSIPTDIKRSVKRVRGVV